MAKNSSSNLDITNNADGFDVTGGTTKRKLTSTGSDITLTGSGASVYTFPSATDTLVGRTSTDTLTAKTLTSPTINTPTITGGVLAAGTATVDPLTFTSGTNLTTAEAGATEYDGTNFYQTIDTTNGRATVPVQQYFRLIAAGSNITTIANYFGTTSNIPLVSSGYYEINIYCIFLKTTASTITWTFTNTVAPTGQNIEFEFSPIVGVNTNPTTPTLTNIPISGFIANDTSLAKAIATSGSLTASQNHSARFKIWLRNSTGTSFKIQTTVSSGSITPGIGSYYLVRRLPASSTGTFAA